MHQQLIFHQFDISTSIIYTCLINTQDLPKYVCKLSFMISHGETVVQYPHSAKQYFTLLSTDKMPYLDILYAHLGTYFDTTVNMGDSIQINLRLNWLKGELPFPRSFKRLARQAILCSLRKSPVKIVAQLKLPLQLDKFLMFEDLEEWNFKVDT